MAEQPAKPKRATKPERVSIAENAPWKPSNPPVHIIFAVKAMAAGKANDQQQMRLLDWMIKDLCKTYDQPYRPGEEGRRDTDFACGLMHVGRELVKCVNMPPDKLRRENDGN